MPDTGSAAEDFRLTLRGMMGFYASPLGAIYAQLVGESQFYPTERERIRTHRVNLRRAAVRTIWSGYGRRMTYQGISDTFECLATLAGHACSHREAARLFARHTPPGSAWARSATRSGTPTTSLGSSAAKCDGPGGL